MSKSKLEEQLKNRAKSFEALQEEKGAAVARLKKEINQLQLDIKAAHQEVGAAKLEVAAVRAEAGQNAERLRQEVNAGLKEIEQCKLKLAEFRRQVGVETDRSILSVDDGTIERTEKGWNSQRTREVNFMKAAVSGRDANDIALALKRADVDLSKLILTPESDTNGHSPRDPVGAGQYPVRVEREALGSRRVRPLSQPRALRAPPPPAQLHLHPTQRHGERGEGRLLREAGDVAEPPLNPKRKVDFPELQPRKVREKERAKLLGKCMLVQRERGWARFWAQGPYKDLLGSIELARPTLLI